VEPGQAALTARICYGLGIVLVIYGVWFCRKKFGRQEGAK
jgi:hypothetical protein